MAKLMATATSKSERDRNIKILKRHGYTGIKVRITHGSRIVNDRIVPATHYEIWANG